jgi:prepilin signal peptidase PulO-like enzyme (type II secretory pathway)
MNDNVLKRLRWTMAGVIALDAVNTLWGQPHTYWNNPSTADEQTPFVRFFAHLGYLPFMLYWLLYTGGAFLLVSRLPKRFAPTVVFTFILPHYFGAATWWVYHWNYGQKAATIYGFVLAVILGLVFVSTDKSGTPP